MDHDLVIRYVGTLGFPVCAALAMGWAFWRLGGLLVKGHTAYLEENTAEMKAQTVALREIKTEMASVCRAACPDDGRRGPMVSVRKIEGGRT